MDLRGNWNYPTSIRFGAGRISELADAVKVVDAVMKFTIRSWECGDLERTSNKHSLVQAMHLPSSSRSSWRR